MRHRRQVLIVLTACLVDGVALAQSVAPLPPRGSRAPGAPRKGGDGARGPKPDPAHGAQIRQVIEAQLDAFAADDAIAAFSFASPGIRRRFGSAEMFLAMVREAYPAVVRPASVRFLAHRERDGGLYQPVHLVDGENRMWVALYRMQRQDDGTWRIDGCELVAQAGTVT